MEGLVFFLQIFSMMLCFTYGTSQKLLVAPKYSTVPATNFSCLDHMAGYFADVESNCQAYHMCDTLGKQYSYLCPNNTVFNQKFMVCDHWNHVNCSNSHMYFDLNTRMAGGGEKVHMNNRIMNIIRNTEKNKSRLKKIVEEEALLKKKKSQVFKGNRTSGRKFNSTSVSSTLSKTEGDIKTIIFQNTRTTAPTFSRLNTTANNLRTTTENRRSTTRKTTFLQAFSTTPKPLTSTTNKFSSFLNKFKTNFTTPSINLKPPKQDISNETPINLDPLKPFILTGPFFNVDSLNITKLKGTSFSPPKKSTPSTNLNLTHPSSVNLKPPQQSLFFDMKKNQHNVHSSGKIMPFMFARNSGPKRGFSFKNTTKSPATHIETPREDSISPFIGEFLRQFLFPINQRDSRNKIDSSINNEKDRERSSDQNSLTTKSRNEFFFKSKDRPTTIFVQTTPTPIIMRGPRQEQLTELRSNRRDRTKTPSFNHLRPTQQSNKAFFIPETELVPPDRINLSNPVKFGTRLPNKVSAEKSDSFKMTMKFSPKSNTGRTHDGLELNERCPECHPAFLTPGKCIPCVRIR